MIRNDLEQHKIAVAELETTYGVRHGHSYLPTDCENEVSGKERSHDSHR